MKGRPAEAGKKKAKGRFCLRFDKENKTEQRENRMGIQDQTDQSEFHRIARSTIFPVPMRGTPMADESILSF